MCGTAEVQRPDYMEKVQWPIWDVFIMATLNLVHYQGLVRKQDNGMEQLQHAQVMKNNLISVKNIFLPSISAILCQMNSKDKAMLSSGITNGV